MNTRIYVVTDTVSNTDRLIRAANKPSALRYAALTQFVVKPTSKKDLVEFISKGIHVEVVGKSALQEMIEDGAV